jgi:hypothetical protein
MGWIQLIQLKEASESQKKTAMMDDGNSPGIILLLPLLLDNVFLVLGYIYPYYVHEMQTIALISHPDYRSRVGPCIAFFTRAPRYEKMT